MQEGFQKLGSREFSIEKIEHLIKTFNSRCLHYHQVTLVFEDFSLVVQHNKYAVVWSKNKPGYIASRTLSFRSINNLYNFLYSEDKVFILERMEIYISCLYTMGIYKMYE